MLNPSVLKIVEPKYIKDYFCLFKNAMHIPVHTELSMCTEKIFENRRILIHQAFEHFFCVQM